MNQYLIVLEKTAHNFSAYSPDIPGCVATGDTLEEARQNIYDAIMLHLEGLKEDKQHPPGSSSVALYMSIP